MFSHKFFDAILARKLSVESNVPSLSSQLSAKGNSTGVNKPGSSSLVPRVVKLDEFDILKQLGRGGYGTVYLVKDKITSGLFALKVVRKHKFSRSSVRAMLQEQKVHCSIKGTQHFLPLEATWHDDVNFYLLMEYCPGDLQLLKSLYGGSFTIERARFYSAELLLAIEELHRQKIIHRDVKPSNVLLRQNGHVYLADFGLAKQFQVIHHDDIDENINHPSFDVDGRSNTGSFRSEREAYLAHEHCGTTAYMAPEILEGQGYSFEVDVWAWAVSLFEMLTAKLPFGNDDQDNASMSMSILGNKLSCKYIVSNDARDLLKKALDKNPDKRISIDDIKRHAFFEGVDWEKLANRKLKAPCAPYAPDIPRHPRSDFPILPPQDGFSSISPESGCKNQLPDELLVGFEFISPKFDTLSRKKFPIFVVKEVFGKIFRKAKQVKSPSSSVSNLSGSTRVPSPYPRSGRTPSPYPSTRVPRAPVPCYVPELSPAPYPSPSPTLVPIFASPYPSRVSSRYFSSVPSPYPSPAPSPFLSPVSSPHLGPSSHHLGRSCSVSPTPTLYGRSLDLKAVGKID